jgi:hypothetical protein
VPARPQRRNHRIGSDDLGELRTQRRQVRACDVLGANRAAGAVGQIEALAGVGDDQRAVAEVRRDPRGGRHAHVGADAEQHDGGHAEPAQAQVEVGADERGVDRLRHHRLAITRREAVAERVAGMRRMQRGTVDHRIVADVDQRPPARAPRVEQPAPVVVHARVVAAAPRREIEAALDVDRDQDGVGIELHGGFCSMCEIKGSFATD